MSRRMQCFIKYITFSILLGLSMSLSAQKQSVVRLNNDQIDMEWELCANKYVLKTLKVKGDDNWNSLRTANYQHNVLYSPTKPETAPQKLYDKGGKEILFPNLQYRYIVASWQQHINAVSLNKAGENIVYYPSSAKSVSDTSICFEYENETMMITETWSLDPANQHDIKVNFVLYPKKAGYYSLTSPSLVSIDKYDFQWATIPGIFQGNAINPDFVQAYGYGQGIPDVPVVVRERTVSTLSSIITDKDGVTIAVTAEPGTGRDPWQKKEKTHAAWNLGVSVMNRDGEFTPTLYHPILGESNSYVNVGDSLSFSFRYTLQNSNWYTVLKHTINDIYKFPDFLKLKQTKYSLTQRLYDMYAYLINDSTSMWRNEEYKGVTIGAQDYRGGVYNSDKDAMKNSDYGAMWMLAKMTNDTALTKKRLPNAINFKLMQQHADDGFLAGSSSGQYYLYKSKQFTEEWGPYTEPIATTYYMLMDMGNVLLFEPNNKALKQHLRFAADCLLGWMRPNGQWEVAYDNKTLEPMFTDVEDLRPTFYGLLIAYEMLKDKKYLEAAKVGADWYIENAVDKGSFLGVCGDTRFSPDFATSQSVQALLELYNQTKEKKYKDAAIKTAEIYTTSVYTHPMATTEEKQVKGTKREDWEISQVGLNFEHGGVFGSANHRGPILLASHVGMFVRMYAMTNDSLFLNMARAAVIGRDAFVDFKTGVASYYWDSMNNGAGPYPHHAWWQIGWITDYLLSEIALRSDNQITFPGGFIAPKVGPHQAYGFAPGKVYGVSADLIMRNGLVKVDNPYMEYMTVISKKDKTLFLILLNNDDEKQTSTVEVDIKQLFPDKKKQIKEVASLNDNGTSFSPINGLDKWNITTNPYGLTVLKIKYK